jgi:hypothetical protein
VPVPANVSGTVWVHDAGQTEYQRAVLERARGAASARAEGVIEWSRQVLAAVRR